MNFWWALIQPLHRARARGRCREQVLEWNDVWGREPAQGEAVLRMAAACVAARWRP